MAKYRIRASKEIDKVIEAKNIGEACRIASASAVVVTHVEEVEEVKDGSDS